MKKIYINEEFMSNVVKGRLLPQFLFKLVKTHTTSLGDNEAFPTSDEYPFDYILLKERYNEVCDAIDDIGLEKCDRDILLSIIRNFGGGPVGAETLAISIGESMDTLEDYYEPYLIQCGLLQRTPRGRIVTQKAYEHLGLAPSGNAGTAQPALF